MDNKPLIKWHAKQLHKHLSGDECNFDIAKIIVSLETVFFNSQPYKDIVAKPPDEIQ